MAPASHRVVIVGGGFGGLRAAQALRRAPVDVTLLDRRNFHLFQPLLYQVATGGLSPANIAAPLRGVLKRQRNAQVFLAEVVGLSPDERRIELRDGESVGYDSLIVATGAAHHYFGNFHWEAMAPGLKTLEDATRIRARILTAFEEAEREPDPEQVDARLTFVVVGGGPTGVELAGALGEVANDTLARNFRSIDPTRARIVLVEGSERILRTYPPELSGKAERSLRRLGVEVRTGCRVVDVLPDRVRVRCGGDEETLPARTVLWAAGVQASPLGLVLQQRTGVELDRIGRVIVAPDMSIPGRPEIFVVGDLARVDGPDGEPLPGVAPVAMQQGAYVARVVSARARGKPAPAPFRYRDRGNMATIGRAAAIAELGRVRLSGYVAWLVWLFVHLMFIVEFGNRVLVLWQWAWNYVTFNRSARLIMGEDAESAERL